jgi:hypothetical protein
VTSEELLASMQRLRELALHRVDGNAELFGDFAVRKVFKFSEDEDLATTRWQLCDRCDEQICLLTTTGNLRGVGRIVEDAAHDVFRYRNRIRGGTPAKKIPRSIAGRREQKTSRRFDRAAVTRPQEPGIRFLHEIINIRRVHETMQIRAQSRFVRNQFRREPCSVIGLGRIHRRDGCRPGVRCKPAFTDGAHAEQPQIA